MKWISSTGAPLILLPLSLRARWIGSLGDAADYHRACATTGYAAVISKDDTEVLVLGDEPMDTAVHHDAGGVVLVRWIHGPSREWVEGNLDALLSRRWKESERARLSVRFELSILMDSAEAGAEADGELVRLAPGSYQVIVDECRDDDTHLLFYRFGPAVGS